MLTLTHTDTRTHTKSAKHQRRCLCTKLIERLKVAAGLICKLIFKTLVLRLKWPFRAYSRKKKMCINDGQAGGTTSDPTTPIWTLLVWKLKTGGILFLGIIMLQGRYWARNRRVRTWYINTFSSVMSAPMGQHLMEVSLSRLPYLPQTLYKEQRSRKGEKEGEKRAATGQKATGLLVVSDSYCRGHTNLTARDFTLAGRTTINSFFPP